MSKALVTADMLRQYMSYDPCTGALVWIKSKSNKAPVGRSVGTIDKNGYVVTAFDRQFYKAHRLIWLLMTGAWPEGVIDHINGVPGDNRWSNLRDVKQAVNSHNHKRARTTSRTGVLGVSPAGKGFKAQIMRGGKQHNLGIYPTVAAAREVYLAAKRQMHEGNTL